MDAQLLVDAVIAMAEKSGKDPTPIFLSVVERMYPQPSVKPVISGEQSASVSNLLSALADAHTEIENIAQDREVEVPIKDRNNPGQFKGKYKFQYATLAGILYAVRPILTERGIWYTQFIRDGIMVTRLFHESGEWMDSGMLPMPDIKGSPQDIGSIVSYFKRYSLSAALGIASEEDNDGEQGDREVSFRAKGAPRSQPTTEHDEEEPSEGWGNWARGLISKIDEQKNMDALDVLVDDNRRRINLVRRVDQTMYSDIGAAITRRRGVLDKDAPI